MQESKSSYKIYSRSRMKIFKPKKYTRRYGKNGGYQKDTKIFYLFLIIIIAIITCFVTYRAIDPVFEKICSNEALSIATKITNDESTRALEGYSYNDMFTIARDESGNIQMITANVLTIDEITSNVASYIQEDLNNTGSSKVRLSMGTFTGIRMLSGMGPNITLRISSSGNVSTDLRSEFISQGINQTLHRIYLQVDCKVSILTPIKTMEENISNQVLLAENVIVGQIPSTYYNFEGVDEMQTLETIK